MEALTENISVAGIDPDLIIVAVIIVGSIIGQIMKAAKGGTPAKRQGAEPGGENTPPATNRNVTDAQRELEEFLQSLAGVPKQQPASPPTPPPIKKTTPAASQKRHTPPPVKKPPLPQQRRKPAPAIQPQRPVLSQVKLQSSPVTADITTLGMGGSAKHSKLRRLLNKDLQSSDSLRKAIVLREVFGPPLGLRS